jgi:hypothetical protein
VPVGLLHYSIVWAVIEGVDVVADNAARLPVFLRTGLRAVRGGCGGVVGGNTATRVVLSEKTSTPTSADITIGSSAKPKAGNKISPSATTTILLFFTGAVSLILAILSFRHFGDS